MENSLNEKPLNTPHNLLVDIREKKYENKNNSSHNSAIKGMQLVEPDIGALVSKIIQFAPV